MKHARETNPWGKFIPVDVESARQAAADDPDVHYLHGRVETATFPDFSCRYWRSERHSATVEVDSGERKTLTANSAPDLGEQIKHVEINLRTQRRKATVTPQEPQTIWVAEILYDTGESERAEASSRDQLLLTLASWVGKTKAQPVQEPPPLWSVEDVHEAISIRQFLEAVGDQYLKTEKNAAEIKSYLSDAELEITYDNLLKAFHFLNDLGLLEGKE